MTKFIKSTERNFNMPAASAYRPELRIFAMFIGRSGSGKSSAACSFNEAGKVIDLDFDYRFAGVANSINQKILTADNLEYEQFDLIGNAEGGWVPVDKKLEEWRMYKMMPNNPFPYKTIITDSASSLARLFEHLSHKFQGGKTMGKLRISGPADYNVESTAMHQYFDYMRMFPANIICTAHVIQKYAKPEPVIKDGVWINQFDSGEVVGEKINIRDNLGEKMLTYFNDVWRFEKTMDSRVWVEFSTDIARNSFGIPPGKHDITGKNFYKFVQELILKVKNGEKVA